MNLIWKKNIKYKLDTKRNNIVKYTYYDFNCMNDVAFIGVSNVV